MKFDSKETECYFYEQTKKAGIVHVNIDKDAVITRKTAEELISIAKQFNK